MKNASPQIKAFSKEMRKNQTPMERRVWNYLRVLKKDGYHFRRQVIFDNYIVDFACHTSKVIIEIDGDSHTTDLAQTKDKRRDHFLFSRGYQVLRFWNSEVKEDIEGVMRNIEHHLPPTPNPSPRGGGECDTNSSPSPLRGGIKGGGTPSKEYENG